MYARTGGARCNTLSLRGLCVRDQTPRPLHSARRPGRTRPGRSPPARNYKHEVQTTFAHTAGCVASHRDCLRRQRQKTHQSRPAALVGFAHKRHVMQGQWLRKGGQQAAAHATTSAPSSSPLLQPAHCTVGGWPPGLHPSDTATAPHVHMFSARHCLPNGAMTFLGVGGWET